MTAPRHLTVTEAFELLGQTLAQTVEPLTVSGTIRGLRRGRTWSRCELITFHDSSVTARLPIAIPPTVTIETGGLENAAVELVGRFEVHPLYGPLQFVATSIIITDPVAASAIETQRFLEELDSLNLLDANKELSLAQRPNRVGLIAPLNGGADFHDLLSASEPGLQIVHRHVPMAGPRAPSAIAAALRELPAAALDVIVICRGGGAASELAVFDHPLVVAGICTTPVPVIVAVGHATDTTRSDTVAHTSVPTPSAAATWLIDRRVQVRHRELVRESEARNVAADAVAAQAASAADVAQAATRQAGRRQAAAMTVAVITVLILFAIIVAWIVVG